MRKALAAMIAGVSFLSLYPSANAQQLAKSGSINFHTGWKYVADVVNATDKHMMGRGNLTGVTFKEGLIYWAL